jgi:DedD protein
VDGFKQRIIGALVLISLAVIFVPMLLDEPHEERTTRSIEIPEEPDFPEVRIEPAQQPVIDDAIEPVPEPEAPPMEIGSSEDEQAAPAPMNSDDTVGSTRQDAQTPADTAQAPPREPAQQPRAPSPTAEPAVPEQPPAVPEQPEAASPSPAEQAVAEAGGYLVQLGSFGSESNAKRLKSSVEDAGFAAYTTHIESGGKTYTRVLAGPFADKDTAAAAKLKLDSEFGLNTLVVVNDR